MTRSRCDHVEPSHDVVTVDIVLDHGDETGCAVLVSHHCRQFVSQLQVPRRLQLVDVIVLHPASNRPTVKLPTPNMDAAIEAVSQAIGDCGLPGPLHTDHEPHATTHPDSRLPARLYGEDPSPWRIGQREHGQRERHERNREIVLPLPPHHVRFTWAAYRCRVV